MAERVPAVIIDVKSITQGTYVEMPGWDPNYVIVDSRFKVSRVNIIGVIVQAEVDGNTANYTLSDQTGTITLRSFDTPEIEAKPEEPVLVIGRPRVYQNEIYLVPELIRTIDPRWAEYRKRELDILAEERLALPEIEVPSEEERAALKTERQTEPREEKPKKAEPEPEGAATDTERIYAMIETIDSGDGADLSEVLAKAQAEGIENAERAIHHMLEMGDIFEIRAGKLKVL